MPAPSVSDFNNAKIDVDDLASIINGSTTVTTRLGGDKLSVDQALSQMTVGNVTVYSAAATYTTIQDWVEESGVMYRPLPSVLPIGPEAFNAANWSPVNGLNLANIEGNQNSVVRSDMNEYLDNQQVADYTAFKVPTYEVGDIVEVAYRDNTTKIQGSGGSFLVALASDFTTEIANDPAEGVYVSLAGGMVGIRRKMTVVDVKFFGLQGDSVTDDFASAVNMMTYEVFSGCALHWSRGEYMISAGLPSIVARGNKWTGDGLEETIINFTGTGVQQLIRVLSSTGNSFSGIWFKYSNGTYTDTLVTTLNSARVSFDECKFGSDTLTSAAYLLDLDASTNISADLCWFVGAVYLVRGWETIETTAVTLSTCWFDRYQAAAIKNVGQGWTITDGCAFEYSITNAGGAIVNDVGKPARGMLFAGNWLGDASNAAGYTWIVINGFGLTITGNYINGDGFLNATAVAVNAVTEGLIVKGNFLSSLALGVNVGTNLVSNADLETNSYNNVTSRVTGTHEFGDNFQGYFEGTFTPVITFGGGSTGITYTRQVGKYVREGRKITYHIDIALSSKGTDTGSMSIAGMPESANGDIGQAGTIGYFSSLASGFTPNARMQESSANLLLGTYGGVTWVQLADTDMTNTTNISISGTYLF